MPGMTGGQLAAELAAIRPDLPVVLCSGFSERQEHGPSIRGLLAKPYSRAELSAAIVRALGRSRAGER
jgi:CheY-like chemotaxis protein